MKEQNNQTAEEISLSATNYVKIGTMIYLRSALPLNHSESWVSLWSKKFGTLDDFPWEDVYGRYPTKSELSRAGITPCPICGEL